MRHLGPEPTAFLRKCIEKCRDESHNGKPRTKDVIALFAREYPELEPSLKPALVVYEASAMGIEMAKGHAPGVKHKKGGGRPKGSKNKAPLPNRPSKAHDVWRLKDAGDSNAEIARKLGISPQAVSKHVKAGRPIDVSAACSSPKSSPR